MEYYRVVKGDTRSLDFSSVRFLAKSLQQPVATNCKLR